MEPLILAIDTSCDETSAAVTCGRKVLSNVISSQIAIHKKYGGVFPALAKRAHEERIDAVVEEALRRAVITLRWEVRNEKLDTEVRKGKDQKISLPTSTSSFPPPTSHLPLIAVNHLEGHIYSCLALSGKPNLKMENRSEKLDIEVRSEKNQKISPPTSTSSLSFPISNLLFPALCLIVSGGHTELALMKNHGQYQILGQTLDDACGEALDKAAKILKLGYPGGPIIERLAEEHINKKWEDRSEKLDTEVRCEKNQKITLLTSNSSFPSLTSHLSYSLSQPLKEKSNLNFSYSGLKTQFFRLIEAMDEGEFGKNIANLAYTFQEAAFEQIIRKTSKAIEIHQPKTILCGGGVIANKHLRSLLRNLAKKNNLPIFFPLKKNLITDNAAMIGVAAYYKYQRKEFVKDIESLDREPRLQIS